MTLKSKVILKINVTVRNANFSLTFFSEGVNILKAIKNATGTSAIFPINISFIHFVFVLTSVPNVGVRFTKT